MMTTPTTTTRGEASSSGSPWALSGLLFIAMFAIGFVFLNVFSTESYPVPFDTTTAEVARYVTENDDLIRWVSFFYGVAAIVLLGFAAVVTAHVRRSAVEVRSLTELAFGGGILAAAFLLLSALALWLQTRPPADEELAVVRLLHDLAYITGGPAHVIAFGPFVGASSMAAWKTGALPRWIAGLGIAAGAVSLLSLTALLWEPAAFVLPAGRVLTFAWIVVVSLVMAGVWPRAADATH